MSFPNWAKIVWWAMLVAALTFFLRERLSDLLAGRAVSTDLAVFGVWVALLVAPLFDEVTLLGVTFKRQIEDLKGELTSQIAGIKTEIRNATDIRTTVSPTFNMPLPPADAQIPGIKAEIGAAVAAAFAEYGRSATPSELNAPESATFLFQIRFLIETELARLARKVTLSSGRRITSISGLARALMQADILDSRLVKAIEEVNSICTPAIHGEPVTEAQVKLVKDVAPELIMALRSVVPNEP